MIELTLAPATEPAALLASLVLIAIVVVLAVAAERSIRRQQGNKTLRRGREERNAAGRVLEKYFRW